MAEALSAYQIWEASVCMAEAHGVRGFPPTLHITSRITPDWRAKRLIINTAPPPDSEEINDKSRINPSSSTKREFGEVLYIVYGFDKHP